MLLDNVLHCNPLDNLHCSKTMLVVHTTPFSDLKKQGQSYKPRPDHQVLPDLTPTFECSLVTPSVPDLPCVWPWSISSMAL